LNQDCQLTLFSAPRENFQYPEVTVARA